MSWAGEASCCREARLAGGRSADGGVRNEAYGELRGSQDGQPLAQIIATLRRRRK